jgi:hypothetical protein
MEQWHIRGVPVYRNDRSSGVVRWKWRRIGPRGEVIAEAKKSFGNIARCLNDAKKHGYVSRT